MAETKLTEVPKVYGNDFIVVSKGTSGNTFKDWQTSLKGETEDAPLHIEDCVNSMPQLFPERETQEYRVLADTQARSLLGSRGAIEDPVNVYYTTTLLNAHAKMLEWQNGEEGCFWLSWYINAQDRTLGVRCQVTDHIPNPTSENGGIETAEMAIVNIGETIEVNGDAISDPTVLNELAQVSLMGMHRLDMDI